MDQIKVLRKSPRRSWEVITIDNTLEALWREVGGYIETVTFATDCVLICNEKGRLLRLAPNHALDMKWAGTILLAGVEGDELADCPPRLIALANKGRL